MPYAEMNSVTNYMETEIRDEVRAELEDTALAFKQLRRPPREITMGWFRCWKEEGWELGCFKGDRYYLTRSGDLIRVWKGIWGGPAYIFPISRIDVWEDLPEFRRFVGRRALSPIR
jgi:hypothetical protein